MNRILNYNKWVCLILVLSSTTLFGQTNLSLEEAVKLCLQNNYEIQISSINSEQARINNSWGEAGRYPTVSLNASQNNNISDQSQNPTSFIQELLISNSLQGGANVNWILFNGFRVKATKERLNQLEIQSEGNASLIIQNSIKATITTYYNAKLQKDKLFILKEVLLLSKERFEYNKLKNDIGTNSSSDLLQFQQAMVQDSSNVLMQKMAYKNAIRNLNLLMNQDVENEYELTTDLPAEFQEYSYSDLKSKMESSNFTLQNEFINKALYKANVTSAKSALYPVISFNGGANINRSQYRIGDFPSIPGTNINYFAGFTLSFNIFDGGKVKRAMQSLKIQEQLTDLNIEKMTQELSKDLTEKNETYLAQKAIYNLQLELLQISKKNLDLAKDKYNSGLINSFNYRDIQLAYINSGISTLESKFNLFNIQLELTSLTGGILDEYSVSQE